MIQSIKIDNFRGLKRLLIEETKRISLLSGRNNVGKSTILEAIYMFYDHRESDVFKRLNALRGQTSNGDVNEWEPLFYDMDLSRTISVQLNDGNIDSRLILQKDEKYIPENISNVTNDVLASFRTFAKNAYALKFRYTDDEDKYWEDGHFLYNREGGMLKEYTTSLPGNEEKTLIRPRYINALLSREMGSVADSIGKLEISGQKKELIEILQLLDPSISDIVTISRHNIPELHLCIGSRWIPIQYAGDGAIKLLQICLAVREAQGGLLLIDEIETGFHYSMYDKLWKTMDQISARYDCQLFITTHSHEMITAAQENLINQDEFVYYRIAHDEDSNKAYRFDHDMLGYAIKSNLEVR